LNIIVSDKNWRTNALKALSVWLGDDTERVGFILDTPSNMNKLFWVFKATVKVEQFGEMLHIFRSMVATSVRVNQAFGRSRLFVNELISRLERHNSNSIRIDLLKILLLIMAAHKSRQSLIKEHNIVPILSALAADTSNVIVSDFSSKLLNRYKDP